jgi:hypothetical protein
MDDPSQPQPSPQGSKAVQSMAPGAGPRDMSGDLQRHRDQPDAVVTTPPGGYPVTVGGNPNAPAVQQTSDDGAAGAEVSAPGPYSLATQWVGGGANY